MLEFFGRRLVAGAVASLGGMFLLTSTASAAVTSDLPINVGSAHILWTKDHYTSDATLDANQLIYHGGAVETTPAVYLVFWGPEWSTGFSFDFGGYAYTNTSAETYLQDFFGGVGGSPWNGVQTQYCQGAAVGAVNCNG